jgi:hypothetical protein
MFLFRSRERWLIFHEDGTTVSSGQGSVIFNADLAKAQVESVGFFRVRGVYQLASSGDSYTGHSYYQFLDANHNDTGMQ